MDIENNYNLDMCHLCSSNCDICTNYSTCLLCSEDYLEFDGRCVE